jgi:ABC-type Fe3+-hydroxamate transport system substrate-binding protein
MNTQKIVFEQGNKQIVQEGNIFFTRVFENGEPFESTDFLSLESAKKHLGIKPTITDNNKLLAEFMNYANGKPITDSLANNINYQNDWNVLMGVVEKIESLGYDVIILHSSVEVTSPDIDFETIYGSSETYSKIEAVYNTCVEFVKWYGGKETE